MTSSKRSEPKTRPTPHLESPLYEVATRHIKVSAKEELLVRAAGRCEFDGCNEYLLEHHLTRRSGNYGKLAHIVAFKVEGPRGRTAHRPARINDASNLMFLCDRDHTEVDHYPGKYSVETLRKYKAAHEERVLHLTGLAAKDRAVLVRMVGSIAGQTVSISLQQAIEAMAPYYPSDRRGLTIDLTTIDDAGESYLLTACETIRKAIERVVSSGSEAQEVGRIALFAFGSIPLLVFLGRCVGNKILCDVFQRHGDTEQWKWKDSGQPTEYKTEVILAGNGNRVALVLSLSGSIDPALLPQDVRDSATIYEMTLVGQTPSRIFLNTREDLSRFRAAYLQAIGLIQSKHGTISEIELFPAVPTPVAVLCGRELLPKVHPNLRVYDFDKAKGGWTYQLTT